MSDTRYYEMGGKHVEAVDFRVHFKDGSTMEFNQSDDIMYMWAVGMTGELNVQRAEFHSTFAAKINESRIWCFSNEDWLRVEVLYDE